MTTESPSKPASTDYGCMRIITPILALVMLLVFLHVATSSLNGGVLTPVVDAAVKPSYTYRGLVLHVVDGDTVDVQVDLGFEVSIKQRLRLLNVYAAERNEPLGKVHTAALFKLVPDGSRVVLRTFKGSVDKYGRYVADVWAETGVHVNEAMRISIGTPAGKGIK